MTIKFTEAHEWIRIEGDTGVVGITDYAQQQLGDVVFVELPDIGKQISKGGESGVIESVKAASELFAPMSGEVTDVNQTLEDEPSTVNSDAMGDGWIYKFRFADIGEADALMDEAAYQKYIEGLD